MISAKKYRIVIIDHPVNIMHDPVCSQLLSQSFKMKFDGYQHTYGTSVLPMDKTDFFATHILFCEEGDDGNLIPIFAYKSTTLERCLNYKVEFPVFSLMKSDGHPSCLNDLENIISKVNNPAHISYDSSWAQNFDYRFSGDKQMKEELREVVAMMGVKHHEDFNIPHMITCGAVKVKTDQFFMRMGLNKLNDQSNFFQKGLNDEESVIFHTSHFSEWCFQMAEKHKQLWDDKLVIDGLGSFQPRKVAA